MGSFTRLHIKDKYTKDVSYTLIILRVPLDASFHAAEPAPWWVGSAPRVHVGNQYVSTCHDMGATLRVSRLALPLVFVSARLYQEPRRVLREVPGSTQQIAWPRAQTEVCRQKGRQVVKELIPGNAVRKDVYSLCTQCKERS